MGGGASKSMDDKPVCLDCDKSQQTNLPSQDPVSSNGGPCFRMYQQVAECMKKHEGQIAPCSKEWEAFQKCHLEQQTR